MNLEIIILSERSMAKYIYIYAVLFHLYEISEKENEFIVTESTPMVAWSWEGWKRKFLNIIDRFIILIGVMVS